MVNAVGGGGVEAPGSVDFGIDVEAAPKNAGGVARPLVKVADHIKGTNG